MKAWGEERGAGDKVRLIADGNADFAKALGLEMDGTGIGFGTRSQRFALVAEDGALAPLGHGNRAIGPLHDIVGNQIGIWRQQRHLAIARRPPNRRQFRVVEVARFDLGTFLRDLLVCKSLDDSWSQVANKAC